MPEQMDKPVDRLEELLTAQIKAYQRLQGCVQRKRRAITLADGEALTGVLEEEASVAQVITELEKHRLELVAELTGALAPGADEALTISQIAETVAAQRGRRLCETARRLRGLVSDVQRESSIVRNAAEALSRHLGGLVQSMRTALNHAGVYGRRGEPAVDGAAAGSVDVRR